MNGIRWKSAILWGAVAEILIIPPFAALVAFAPLLTAQYAVIPLAFLATLAGGWWVARKSARKLLNGTLTGLAAYLFYVAVFPAIGWIIQSVFGFRPPEEVTTPPPAFVYPLANAMKVIGGAVGGWVAARNA